MRIGKEQLGKCVTHKMRNSVAETVNKRPDAKTHTHTMNDPAVNYFIQLSPSSFETYEKILKIQK